MSADPAIGSEADSPQSSMFRTEPCEETGRVFGERYRLVGYMARGATANVYLATDLQTNERVVIKRLNHVAAQNPELCRRFLLEAKALLPIDHASVVRVLSVGEAAPPSEGAKAELPYLVMEALAGESLGDLLRRQNQVSIDLGLIIARHAATGLAAAHRAGVIHRDVKPDNLLLLGPRGEPFAVKVIDFGMAKIGGDSGSSHGHLVMGTAQYMAPEQILADPVDARTDIYALGVVMFRMFTGHLPFDTEPQADLLAHQLYSPAPPASWLVDGLDPYLEMMILRCMRKHPDNRYLTMESLIVELDAFLGIRSGSSVSFASPIPRRDPDVYVPVNPRGREAAQAIARRFKVTLPE